MKSKSMLEVKAHPTNGLAEAGGFGDNRPVTNLSRVSAVSSALIALALASCGSDPAACPPGQELVDGLCVTPSGSAEAMAFCADYAATCGFGGAGRHPSAGACLTAFDSYDSARQDCVVNHRGLAAAGDPNEHCPHATGQRPCD